MRERQGSGLMGAVAATLARQYPICSARAWAPHATLRRVPGAIRTHTVGVLSAATPAIGLRAHGAATRCRPGSPALRGQGRSRARRRGFRGWTRTSGGRGQGPAGDAIAPPGIKGPGLRCRCESAWLPASRARARCGSRTRIRQVLRLAALPVGCTRAWCAARGSNSAPQIKSLMHHHNACSA